MVLAAQPATPGPAVRRDPDRLDRLTVLVFVTWSTSGLSAAVWSGTTILCALAGVAMAFLVAARPSEPVA